MAYISALPASSATLSGRSNKICQRSRSFLPRRALSRTQTAHTSLRCVLRPQSVVRPARASIRTAAAPTSQATKDEDLMEMELDISIKGMMCDGCTSRVQEALEKAEGVSSVKVSLEQGMATVDVRVPSQLEAFAMLPRLVETVRVLGFEAEPHIDGL